MAKSGCIRAKFVVFEKRWLYSGKSCSVLAKWFFSDQLVLFGQKWLYSGKVAVVEQNGCILVKWLYSRKVVVFTKVVVFSKIVVFGQK